MMITTGANMIANGALLCESAMRISHANQPCEQHSRQSYLPNSLRYSLGVLPYFFLKALAK